MASVRKRSNGSYQAQVRTVGFKAVTKTYKLKSDAVAWSRDLESQQARGLFTDVSEASQAMFVDCLDRYEEEQEAQGRKSIASLKSQIRMLKQSNLSHLSLINVTAKEVTGYRNARMASGLKAASVIKDITMLSAFFNHVQKEWHITLPKGNPVSLVSNPKHKDPTSRERRFEGNEEQMLIEYLEVNSPKSALVVRMALATGMRRGEILNIALGHVDDKKKTILIPVTKTGYPRVIPLPDKAWDIVREVALGPDFPVNFYDPNEVFLFNITPDAVTKAFSRACNALKIKDLRFHDTRHEAISRLFEQGLGMMEVALVSGHKGFDMLKKYTHLRPSSLLDRMNA